MKYLHTFFGIFVLMLITYTFAQTNFDDPNKLIEEKVCKATWPGWYTEHGRAHWTHHWKQWWRSSTIQEQCQLTLGERYDVINPFQEECKFIVLLFQICLPSDLKNEWNPVPVNLPIETLDALKDEIMIIPNS